MTHTGFEAANPSRRARVLRLAFRIGLVLLLLALAGCAAKEKMRQDAEQIKARAGQVRDTQKRALELRGPACGLKELAIAESHRAFALYELDQGHYPRYRDHLSVADEHLKLAWAKAKACEPPDHDGDGILDPDDRCPDHREDIDEFQDEDGCPDPDNDQDGIPDELDKCSDGPEDYDGFQDEDGCPDLDNDQDTVPDRLDHCLNHPEDKDDFLDEDGCPDPDNDQDGIPDAQDGCPKEPETYNGETDEDGCPEENYKNIQVTEKEIKIKQKIFFATDRATILPQSFPVLDEIVQAMTSHSTLQVEVGGHTDNNGVPAYNKRLSQQRADAVRTYLITKGIDGARLTAVGFGEELPIESNRTATGRATNRRVEFKILKR